MSDRYDLLSPKDLIITLRSLARRFGAVVGPMRSDPELFDRIDERGPDGPSMGEVLSETSVRFAALVTESLHLANQTAPVISGAAIGASPQAASGSRLPMEQATASIEGNAEALADTLDRQDGDGWARSAALDSGGSIDLITLVRSAVRAAIEGLRAAEAQLEHLRQNA